MATLVLTTVGSALGGPIGGMIGAMLGQQADRALFAPAAREGARLSDLAIQTSTYGARIPKLFGATRVSGTVIWATDLREERHRQSNGKGRGSTNTYSYSASFAVLLSARPIVRIGRIWADGNLLRGSGGDLKVETRLTVHTGSADQLPDPLIAAAEGGGAPAYRGRAYAVFDGLQLASYGNRIPSLSFEVFADAAPVAGGAMLAELAQAGVVADAGPILDGFVASGDDVRGVAEGLAGVFRFAVRDEGGVPALRFAAAPSTTIAIEALGASIGDAPAPRLAIDRRPADAVPVALTLGYADPARDYQPGLQRARREGAGLVEDRRELPVTMTATAARAAAERALGRLSLERTRATATLPWHALTIKPGDAVTIGDGAWRVAEVSLEKMIVRLDLVATGATTVATTSAASGRAVGEPDLPPGPTTLALVDLPQLGDTAVAAPQVAIVAAGASAGWRRAELLVSSDAGASFEPVGTTALPAIMGRVAQPLPPGGVSTVDRINVLDVVLLNAAMLLNDADTTALLAGANRAMVGDELLQYGRARPLGQGVWRLFELWRGRRGTEWAVGGHGADEAFVLIEDVAVVLLPAERTQGEVRAMAVGIGDASPYPVATLARPGAATMPLSPVALMAAPLPGGDTMIGWTRRSREGWRWIDAIDAPIGEEREAWRVTRTTSAGVYVTDIATGGLTYTAAERAADRAAGATAATFAVVQLGNHGGSRPALLTIAL